MKENNNERLAVIENQLKANSKAHKELKDGQLRTECKVDDTNRKIELLGDKISDAIDRKADRSEVVRLDNKVWGLVVGILLTILGLILTAVKAFK